MVENPYQVLGISQSATQDEIKKAYRKKAKEYHPDLHPNDAEAARKMNEVNEAYDMLQNPEKYAKQRAEQEAQQRAREQYNANPYGGQRSYGQYYSQSSQSSQSTGGSYGWQDYGFNFEDFFGGFYGNTSQSAGTRPQYETGDSREVQQAVSALQSGSYGQALGILTRIPSAYRNARWYYLTALANRGLGNMSQAIDMMAQASRLNPNNGTYHQLLQQFRREEQAASQRSSQTTYVRRSPFGIFGRIIFFLIIFRLITWLFTMMAYGGGMYFPR